MSQMALKQLHHLWRHSQKILNP